MKKYYRIVRDDWCGYEVQRWRWWWPFWIQCWSTRGPTNTHSSIQQAKDFIDRHSSKTDGVVETVTIEGKK